MADVYQTNSDAEGRALDPTGRRIVGIKQDVAHPGSYLADDAIGFPNASILSTAHIGNFSRFAHNWELVAA